MSRERRLVEESNAARDGSDYDTARAKAAEAVELLLQHVGADRDPAWLAVLDSSGLAAYNAQDGRTAARAWKRALDARALVLPDEHPELQLSRLKLAATLHMVGDLPAARALFEAVVEVAARTLPDDHPYLLAARGNLAVTLNELGDLQGARAMQARVLEVAVRTLPDDHPDLQNARGNLAVTIAALGDLPGARALQEKVLEVCSRTLPADHPRLQAARQNLAATLQNLGDLAGAQELEANVLEVRERTLPNDHPDVQAARGNLAVTTKALGDLARARELETKVLEVFSRVLPDEHADLQSARQNLAATLGGLGEIAGARALHEKVLEVYARTLPDDHPALQAARGNLALTIANQVVRMRGDSAPAETRHSAESEGAAACATLVSALVRAHVHAARSAIFESSGREAEERWSRAEPALDQSLSFVHGYGVFAPMKHLAEASFVLAETTRSAALASSRLARRAANAPKYDELRDALKAASDALARLAREGASSEDFDRARVKRESVERELAALASELSGGSSSAAGFDVESCAARLDEHEAAVSFRRYARRELSVGDGFDSTGQPVVRESVIDSACAFVVRRGTSSGVGDSSATLALIDLGPIAPIEAAVRAWRDGLGVGAETRGVSAGSTATMTPDSDERGTVLRERVFDPLLPQLAGVDHLVVVLDDVLHLVPIDALPLDERAFIGDRWQVETRATLAELLDPIEPAQAAGELVAFGDVEYGVDATSSAADAATRPAAVEVAPRSAAQAGVLRGGAWSYGFTELPGTGAEARGIALCFAEEFRAAGPPELCEHADATRERLFALAPKARFLHVATHGWFAPESIKSWSDPEPLDKKSGLGTRMSGEEQVRGMSPMLLCGLALAGANLPENAVGRAPGLITADELSTLDLSNCELAVLSACDTNVGERRAGQGVHSLQMALQMAGARSVITSLWKVPDEATKELMLDFYRRLWVEKKPKWQALWEAKKQLREARGPDGRPLYTTRDWAAWVLTGDPN